MKYIFLLLSLSLFLFGFIQLSYDKPNESNMIQTFGDSPLSLNKDFYVYNREPTQDYEKTNVGILNYFTSIQAHEFHIHSQESYSNTPKILIKELGIDNVPWGDIIDEKIEVHDNRINYHELYFKNGPILQYYIGTPEIQPIGNMIFLHGCSSYPDLSFGLGEQDYTNNAALQALNDGWIVYSLHVFSTCDLLDNYDTLGTVYANSNLFGYYTMAVAKIIEYHNLND